MKIFSLLEIQYQSFTNAVKKYLSDKLSNYNASYGNSTIFGQLINVLSGVVQNIMLYIEDAFTEQNKYTAQRKKSIYGLAALSGYKPDLGKSTGVQLKINFTPNNESFLNVIINNHQRLVCTQNGMYYNLILPQEAIILSIEKDNNQKVFYAVQGQFESQSFISTGGKFYTQNFKYQGHMDVDYLEVRVNDEVWEKVDSIYDMKADGKQYTYQVSINGGLNIIFGNDIHGRALQNGDLINITYLTHDGELGNINVDEETYFVFDDDLKNIAGEEVDGNSIFNVTFANNDPITSGSNSETTEHVRQMIGYNSRSMVLSSPDNYKSYISKFSFCGYNRTWSEPGSLVVNSMIMKNYKQLISSGGDYFNKLTESDFYLTDSQKQSIINSISNNGNQLAGITYNIIDPELCKYALYVYITLKNNSYDQSYITNKIRDLIGDFFCNINSDIFIPKSDIIHLLKTNISEIDSVDLYFLSEKNETALQKKQYNKTEYIFNPSTGSYDKREELVYIYDGENPNLGLDEHGNIYLESNQQFPVLMGGWDFLSTQSTDYQEIHINDPLIIVYK